MNARQAIRNVIKSSDFIVKAYLEDLSDAELLVRPVPGANHIAWQLGHLITSEHEMIEATQPGSMAALPPDFKEKYTAETSKLDDPKAFHTKAEYLKLMDEQRAGTLGVLERITDSDLDKEAPEPLRSYAPTIADVLAIQGSHYLMHAGQWAVTRRKLGRKPLF
jgi:uncharacterized damage-inducible protein DinB